jgi:hypothetical protein
MMEVSLSFAANAANDNVLLPLLILNIVAVALIFTGETIATFVCFWRRVCCLYLKTHQQVKAFLRFVVPQFGGSNLGTFFDQIQVLIIASVRKAHSSPA